MMVHIKHTMQDCATKSECEYKNYIWWQ